jgi:DNA modification methylase
VKKLVNIAKVKENPSNPRFIKDGKFKKLVQSIKAFPEMLEKRPIVVDEDMVVLGGNMRLKACKSAGLFEVWVDMAEGWSQEQKDEFIIKDNDAFGEWDWDILANEWDVNLLYEWGLDLPPMFDDPKPEAKEDDYTEPDQMQVDVVLGDLVEIGEHRLLCGDSTDSDQVAKLMDGEKADMVFTDPPYGENINFSYLGHTTKLKHNKEVIKNDELSGSNLSKFLLSINSNLKLFNIGAYYVCSGWKQLPIFQTIFEHSMLIVWDKKQLGFGMGDYRNQTEFILYNKNNGLWFGDNSQRNVFEINRVNDNKLHPTIKPIALCEKAINNSSKPKDLVFDLFLGSGSTMVAAHQLNRKCYGMELDPKYCQVIIDRMHKLDPSLKIKINGQKYTPNDNGAEV